MVKSAKAFTINSSVQLHFFKVLIKFAYPSKIFEPSFDRIPFDELCLNLTLWNWGELSLAAYLFKSQINFWVQSLALRPLFRAISICFSIGRPRSLSKLVFGKLDSSQSSWSWVVIATYTTASFRVAWFDQINSFIMRFRVLNKAPWAKSFRTAWTWARVVIFKTLILY